MVKARHVQRLPGKFGGYVKAAYAKRSIWFLSGKTKPEMMPQCKAWKANRTVLRIKIANDLAEMAQVADLVDEFARSNSVPLRAANAMNLALDEVLSNVIRHGYPHGGRHQISVSITVTADRLEAQVKDDGVAFDPRSALLPQLSGGLHERPEGHVGLHFVRSLMDEIEYARIGRSNRLRLAVRLVNNC